MMNFDSYKIITLPTIGKLQVDGVDALVNVIYHSSKLLTFIKVEQTFSEPFTSFKVKTFSSSKESNVSTITVNVPPNKSLLPQSNNLNKTIYKNDKCQ